jgi:hypothetical protein
MLIKELEGNMSSAKTRKSENKAKSNAATVYEIGRIIINKGSFTGIERARAMLNSVIQNWPANIKVSYLISSGGFIFKPLKTSLPFENDSEDEIVAELTKYADEEFKEILKGAGLARLRKIADVFSTGIDFYIEDNKGKVKTVEFVAVYDLKKDKIHITGKSYPTTGQAKALQKVNDLKSHFLKLNGKKVMVLGCHDLNVFNPRAIKEAGGWRKEIIEQMGAMAAKFKPEIVLQHPHTTDVPGTWRNSWYNIKRLLPTVREFAGSGNYYNNNGEIRGKLEDCLSYTATKDVLNVIVSPRKPHKVKFEQNKSRFKFL